MSNENCFATALKAILVLWLVTCFIVAGVVAIGWVVYAASAMLIGNDALAGWIGFCTGGVCLFGAVVVTVCLIGGDEDDDV